MKIFESVVEFRIDITSITLIIKDILLLLSIVSFHCSFHKIDRKKSTNVNQFFL